MTATSGRLLKLLSLLQTRRDWTGDELAHRLEVSGRTIRRDIERLRELGYPVDALTGPAGGYRLHAGTAMPPLLLDDDEAVAIAVGLRTAARASVTGIEETSVRALVKLEQVLPSHLRRRVNALQTATVTLDSQRRADGRPRGADGDRRRLSRPRAPALRLSRPRRRRDQTHRRAPHAGEPGPTLVPRRLGLRPRRLADLPRRPPRAPLPGGRRFEPRALPNDDAAAFVAANLSGAPARYQARVTLFAPLAEVAAAVALHRNDRRGDRRAHVRAAHERRLAGLAGRARGHGRRRLRGPRAARARRARPRAGRALGAGDGRRW